MKNVVFFFCFMAVATSLQGQRIARKAPYKHAAGIRISPVGQSYDLATLSYKLFFSPRSAFEINAGIGKAFQRTDYSYRTDGKLPGVTTYPPMASASYQLHIPMFRGMSFIIGGTAIIMLRYTFSTPSPPVDSPAYPASPGTYTKRTSYTSFGFGPVGGFDYAFQKIPLNLTLDHRPAFLNINRKRDGSNALLNIALAARYTFGKPVGRRGRANL